MGLERATRRRRAAQRRQAAALHGAPSSQQDLALLQTLWLMQTNRDHPATTTFMSQVLGEA